VGFFEVIAALMLIVGGVFGGGLFGALFLVLLFGKLRLNTTLAMNLGGVVGAALGVCFALVVVRGWDGQAHGGPVEQTDEERWLRP
jgi:hypothetical protein